MSAACSQYFVTPAYNTTMDEIIRLAKKRIAFQDTDSEFMKAVKSFVEDLTAGEFEV
jgi:hypothetical protein